MLKIWSWYFCSKNVKYDKSWKGNFNFKKFITSDSLVYIWVLTTFFASIQEGTSWKWRLCWKLCGYIIFIRSKIVMPYWFGYQVKERKLQENFLNSSLVILWSTEQLLCFHTKRNKWKMEIVYEIMWIFIFYMD